MKPGVRLKTSQSQTMTPQLLQSIRLLQLSAQEMEQELREAIERNVMLEIVESDDDELPDSPEVDDAEADTVEAESDADAVQMVEAEFDWSERDSWTAGSTAHDEEDEGWEARQAMPEIADARLQAIEQLKLVVRSSREARLVSVILDAIDDNGYLVQPLDGIALEAALQPEATIAEVEAALEKVQSVEPSGFGARDLRECLMLQLKALPRSAIRRLAMEIVDTQLEALAEQDFAVIGEQFEVTAEELRPALDLILSLDPKPAAAHAAAADAAVPDVIVSGTPGAWKIMLNSDRLPRVRVNQQYERCLNGTTHRMMRDQLQEARWLVRGIEMRNDTLLRTARAIFQRQQAFLTSGEEGMAPLTLREIADAIGMHESTVCRVTASKWVQTPWGIYEMKAFFPSQITGVTGDTSGTAVKAMIRRIVDGETLGAPLCDGDIAAILARKGVHVARRTVAKYREAMKIPSAKERRPLVGRRALRLAS